MNSSPMIYKSNELIQKFRNKFSLQEMKIINYLISNINSPKYDKEFNTITVSYHELARSIGYDSDSNVGGKTYKDIKKSLLNLSNKTSEYFEMINEDGKVIETYIRWLEKPRFNKTDSKVVLKLDDDLKPFLLDLTKNFTKYELYISNQMQSKYSIKLFELLKSWEKTRNGQREFDLDFVKEYLDVPASYKNFAYFKERILDKAIKEINEVTELLASYETKKKGKKVVGLIFHISKKEIKTEPPVVTVPCEEKETINKEQDNLSLFYVNSGLSLLPNITEEKTKYVYLLTVNILKNISKQENPAFEHTCFHVYQKVLQINMKSNIENKYAYLKKTLENEYKEIITTKKENEVKEDSLNGLPAWWNNSELIKNEEEFNEDDLIKDIEKLKSEIKEPVY